MAKPNAKQHSIRWRITLIITLVAALGQLIVGVLSFVLAHNRADNVINDSLGRSIQELREYANGDEVSQAELNEAGTIVYGAVQESVNAIDECTLGYLIAQDGSTSWTQQGENQDFCLQIRGNPNFEKIVMNANPAAAPWRDVEDSNGIEFTYAIAPVQVEGAPPAVYIAAINRGERLADVRNSYLTGYLPLALASVALILGVSWWVTRLVLRPLTELAQTSKAITDTVDLSLRVPVESNDEVGQVARSFNTMVESLDRSFSAQRRLLDDIGHELRTPLTVIQGHLEIADKDTLEQARDLALDEVERMTGLVNSAIVLASTGRPDFVKLQEIQLAPLLDEVLDKSRALGEREWRIISRTEVTAMADPRQLTQALLQLAANGVKYSEPGSKIGLGLSLARGEARMVVQDEGIGIEPAEQQRIFERFARGVNTERIEGIGLGLSIVSAIAAAHGGSVEVESAPGIGSRFTIVLPNAHETVLDHEASLVSPDLATYPPVEENNTTPVEEAIGSTAYRGTDGRFETSVKDESNLKAAVSTKGA
jgi:signal transduction histidine kinase